MKLFFATDGSRHAEAARDFLALLPLPEGTTIHVASFLNDWAVPTMPYGEVPALELESLREAETQHAQEAVERDAAALSRDGLSVTTAVLHGEPAHGILRAADEEGADLIVVGSAGRTGLDAFLLGSVARNVAKHARRPVLVARAPRNSLHEVVFATDGSDHATRALQFLARLPLPAETRVTAVNVVRSHDRAADLAASEEARLREAYTTAQQQKLRTAEALVESARGSLKSGGKRVEAEVRFGDPAAEILDLAQGRHADLVVAGARGVSLIEALFVGSVADRLLKETPCSVLIVH